MLHGCVACSVGIFRSFQGSGRCWQGGFAGEKAKKTPKIVPQNIVPIFQWGHRNKGAETRPESLAKDNFGIQGSVRFAWSHLHVLFSMEGSETLDAKDVPCRLTMTLALFLSDPKLDRDFEAHDLQSQTANDIRAPNRLCNLGIAF